VQIVARDNARVLRIGSAVCMILASMSLIAIPMDARGKVRTCSDDGKDIDPDIGGIGILLGLFLPCLVLLGSLQGRNFRCEGIVYGSMRKCVTVQSRVKSFVPLPCPCTKRAASQIEPRTPKHQTPPPLQRITTPPIWNQLTPLLQQLNCANQENSFRTGQLLISLV
jgi:hypothetical protein